MRPFWPFLELLSRRQSADVRGAGTHDKPLRTFAWETKSNRDLTKFSGLTFMPSVISRNVFRWSYAEVCGQVRLPVVWRIRLQNELILHEIFLQFLITFLNHFFYSIVRRNFKTTWRNHIQVQFLEIFRTHLVTSRDKCYNMPTFNWHQNERKSHTVVYNFKRTNNSDLLYNAKKDCATIDVTLSTIYIFCTESQVFVEV